MIPAYVHRNNGVVSIAEAACEKDSLVNALKELESLIDGDPSRITRVNEFWPLKPTSKSNIDLVSYFFSLKNEAAFAGITNEMLVIKFLDAVPGGERIFESNKDKIKADMEISAVTEIFKAVQFKLAKVKKGGGGKLKKVDKFMFLRDFSVKIAIFP